MKKTILMAVAILAALSSFTKAQHQTPPVYEMTLEDCINYAVRNNYSRQSVSLNEDIRNEVLNQSKRERLPNLSANVSENLSHSKGNEAQVGGSYGVSTSVTVYQGDNINNTIKQNEVLSEQASLRTSQYDNELTVQILRSFLSVLSNEELLKYQRAVLKASEEQLRQGEAMISVGSILESDYMLFQAQYASDLDNIYQSEINRDNNLLALKSLMSMPAEANLRIIYPDSSTIAQLSNLPTEREAVDMAMNTLPDVLMSIYDIRVAELNVDLARSSLFPTVSVGGNIGTGHTNFSGYGSQLNNRRNEGVGLTVSIPIYNRGATKSRINQNRIALRQTELDTKQTLLGIRQTVIQEYRNVLASESNYRASTIKQNAYLSSFRAYRAQFNEGAITAVELLQQQNNYINALNEYIQNKYGFILQRKILDVYMGVEITM